jgi:hypothetical protein
MTTWVSRAPRPRLASQPRSRHAVKFAESFAVAFPARASPGVVTQRLGLQARTKKRGKAKPGRIRKREERKSAQWGPPRPRGSSSPSRLYLSEAGSLAPRCPRPFPSAPQTLLLGSAPPSALPPPGLPPPSSSPGGITSSRPGGGREPLAGGHHSPAPVLPPRAAPVRPRSPRLLSAAPRGWGPSSHPTRPGLVTCCAASCFLGACTSAAPGTPPPPSRVRRCQLGQLRRPGGRSGPLDFSLPFPPPSLPQKLVCV